jgi:lipopolysaccharide/colanic/teichoic acid biosynthesis glycosyltransferase
LQSACATRSMTTISTVELVAPSAAQELQQSGIIRQFDAESVGVPEELAALALGPGLAVRTLKRAVDLCFAGVGLSLAIWLLPLIALAIRIDSRGPIFFRQRRASRFCGRGPDGALRFVEFEMLKFRTMIEDAEAATGPVLASQDDPRVTRVGRLLRRTRLDELPQLWNVLKGEMSLVGPRPERSEILANLMLAIPFFEERSIGIKPGITGFAQVSLGYSGKALEGSEIQCWEASLTNPFELPEASGAEADDMRMKLLYDLAYAVHMARFSSFVRLELEIIGKTPLVMLRGLGR